MKTKALFETDQSGAIFSPDRQYRYSLWRIWDDRKPLCNYLLLNPSKADADENDPTVKGCIERSKRSGFGGLIVTNLFALVSTDRNVLFDHPDPVGPENDNAIRDAASRCYTLICGWGEYGSIRNRSDAVLDLLDDDYDLFALRINKSGQPIHPLYVGYDVKPIPFGRTA